ncbi:uncharacterized protein LOC127729931 [Mytilus californianus]|uniref:uncharacterized protein LOC127729931 n=1 Tax=Mytilus californianus TaxID=6549 RepID=UPI002245226F|nr:uncharacterized protein LOC127729931 [Mytilus californianus]
MEVAGINLLTFVGFVLTTVAAVLDLIGFVSPYWSTGSGNGIEVNAGLWRYCYSGSGTSVCGTQGDTFDLESWFKAVQAMETLGFLCLLAAAVVVIIKLKVLKDKPVLKFVGIGCLAAAAAFILLGVCIYGAKINSTEIGSLQMDNLHFAFALVIIAAIIAIVASVLFVLDK